MNVCVHKYAVADPETSERGGPRNMKYKTPCVEVIFFFGLFLQAGGGGHGPLGPPPLDPLLVCM